MADQDMRLRLVVRRHNLPEARIMWNVRLNSDPTIAKLLEQLNEDIPLESDQWGLEDYVVELHDYDGTEFECLHYQLVRGVLKPDDRVFIRALERDDHRRRRISGRHQISSDGRHLIDGVPFGRPRLKMPSDRPPVRIPPRKRVRLTYDQQDNQTSDLNGDSSTLLLTDGGSCEGGQTLPGLQVMPEFVDANTDGDDSDFTDDVELDDASGDSPSVEDTNEDESEGDGLGNEEEEDGHDSDGSESDDLDQEARDLADENATLEGTGLPVIQTLNLEVLDKLSALRAAFPSAPVDICEKVLAASKGNLKTTYKVLAEGFGPQLSQEAVMVWNRGSSSGSANLRVPALVKLAPPRTLNGPSNRTLRSSKPATPEESDNEESNEHDATLLRKFDRSGFPPGTITSGKGLAHMAMISASFDSSGKSSGASQATATTLKIPPTKAAEEEDDDDDDDDDTSSSGTSSASTSDSDDSDVQSELESSSGRSSDQSSSSDSDDSDSDSDDGTTQDTGRLAEADGHRLSKPTSENDASNNDSDSGPEECSFALPNRSSSKVRSNKHNDASKHLDDTSESGSTGSDPSSESEQDLGNGLKKKDMLTTNKAVPAQTTPRTLAPSLKLAQTHTAPTSVPPGAGKERTKRRNARRRAANKAKREEQETEAHNIANDTGGNPLTTENKVVDPEAALLVAKRKALLDAIATGGIEIEPSGRTAFDDNNIEAAGTKRKRAEAAGTSQNWCPEYQGEQAGAETPTEAIVNDPPSTSGSQKRRRIDLGAGRRLLFGALGLRNPKTKEDEDKLHDKVMSDTRPSINSILSAPQELGTRQPVSDEDDQNSNAWSLRINYRAVECCYDGLELSPAPFPFQQRWDSQQQSSSFRKRNKRGGQSKRAQRNQAQFYNEDSRLGQKRRGDNSGEWMKDEYDNMFDGGEGDVDGANVELNYDDVESQHHGQGSEPVNETSQATDIDDLPSLPKDISTLPPLHPGQARVGMVITWQKWSCSSATNWQPQLSAVTAIVIRVDDDTAALEVCLAKRDRHLDGYEKRYDRRTGQRIYDRFEAPDLDEDEDKDSADTGVAEGYRSVSWAELQDPRILQQPLDITAGFEDNSKFIEAAQVAESLESPTNVGNESQAVPHIPSVSSPLRSTTREHLRRARSLGLEPPAAESISHVDQISEAYTSPGGRLEDSSVGQGPNATSNSISHQAERGQQAADLSMSDASQISSPSRQLHETTCQALSGTSPIHHWPNTSDIIRDESLRPNSSGSMPLPITESPLPCLEGDTGSYIIAGAPRVLRHHAAALSLTNGLRSRRQLDYPTIANENVPDSFNATDDVNHNVPICHNSQHHSPLQAHGLLSTPTPSHQAVMPNDGDEIRENNILISSPARPPSSRSLSSLNTVWCSALTSRNTQSPSKTQESSSIKKHSKSQVLRDREYEETMHNPDESSDSSDTSISNKDMGSVEVKKEEGSEPDSGLSPVKSSVIGVQPVPRVLEKISPPPRRRRAPNPFTLPPGTQVLELSSDSEPIYDEDYADDEVDGTYSPRQSSLRRGDGWVKKKNDEKQRTARSTAASLGSLGSQEMYSQSFSSSHPPSAVSAQTGRSRRKISARF
ncbi:hypothetical protein F5Y19DRAFT_70147 [Xylariaceae sp. FL1651]|nr:hypothetical protein F5Y19DRAFT_70147 [Xylariaceae sp. FL1651]